MRPARRTVEGTQRLLGGRSPAALSTVADLLVEGLARAGVARIFAAPRTVARSEVIRAAGRAGVPVIACSHGSAACIMAAVTGELTGRPGAALSASGSGVTASLTGLAHARHDRAPMLYLSERQAGSTRDNTREHRFLDDSAFLAPIAKGSEMVAAVSASHALAHAVQLALADPRGPVHLDVTADTAREPAVPMALHVDRAPQPPPEMAAIERAANMILSALRPLVIAGHECRGSDANWLRAFCEAMPAPVLTTAKGKGALPEPHPLSMGVWGDDPLDDALTRRADLVIGFGVDAEEMGPGRLSRETPVLSLTRSGAGAGGSGTDAVRPTFEVVGDLGAILEELAPRLVGHSRVDWDVAEIDRLRMARRRAVDDAPSGFGHRVVQIAREFTPAGTIATADAGPPSLAAAAHWHAVEPREFLVSGIGAPGFAVPAAIAAQLVHPDRRVLCFAARLGVLLAVAELETAVQHGLPITIVVLDEDAGTAPDIDPPTRRSAVAPDLCALARTLGLSAVPAAGENAFTSALLSAVGAPGPALIDVSGPGSAG